MQETEPWEFVLLFLAVVFVFGVLLQMYLLRNKQPDNETDEERAKRVFDEFP
jgi:hypothetical protein